MMRMKRIVSFGFVLLQSFFLFSCFESTTYPNMVEYKKDDVLAIAKEKYEIKSFFFTEEEYHGEKEYDEFNNLIIKPESDKFSSLFINGDNLATAFSSFAGKNGGHDIQGMYKYFLCYVALGVDKEDKPKYIYYNTNLDKDIQISDTIGLSDYPYDILPNEITNELIAVPPRWGQMNLFMNKHFTDINKYLKYSKDKLTFGYTESLNLYVYLEFYKENEIIVYDLRLNDRSTNEEHLIYSTSCRYEVIYTYYGIDFSQYVEVRYEIEQSMEEDNLELLEIDAKIKPVNGTIIYSQLSLIVNYKAKGIDDILNYQDTELFRFTTEAKKGILLEKIDGINHYDSTSVKCNSIYVLYEKN